MPAPYSNDLRQKMVACYEQGELSQEAVANRFSVSVSCFKRLWKRYQETGRVAPAPMGGWVEPKVDEAGGAHLREWLKEAPDLTLEELCERYEKQLRVSMSTSALHRGLKRLKISYKKKRFMTPSKRVHGSKR